MKYIRQLLILAALVPALGLSTALMSVAPTLAQTVAAATVDINTATDVQLQTLPGVGPATAAAIIKARPFKDLKDFTARVKGISAANLSKITPLATFSAPTSSGTVTATGRSATADGTDAKIAALKKSGKNINLNTASAADLQLLPLVGDKTAAEIIKNRPYKDLAELQTKVKGIGAKTAADLAPFISFK